MDQFVPPGFTPLSVAGGFHSLCGPIYRARNADTPLFGFVAEEKHGNVNEVLHGGMLMTFADTIMGALAQASSGRYTATISLNVEFVTSAPPAGWIEGRPTLTRLARTVAFVRCDITGGGKTLMTASGVWRVFDQTVDRPTV